MTQNSKFFILFSLIYSALSTNNAFCATVSERGSKTNITNKSSTFSTQLSSKSESESASELAEKIRAQRAAIDAHDNQSIISDKINNGTTSNNCDKSLRTCIENRCGGSEYTKCSGDSDTTFSDKLNACKKNANCTAHEFSLFANQIKEDKKQAINLSSYNKVIDCGNRYNDCIITECGKKFNKCLNKSDGDKAIAKCQSIATDCKTSDSGLTSRIGTVFGIVRTNAEKQILADETKLRNLRDQMRDSCKTLGALFDDRSLDCVFTASFYAGDDTQTPKASKKLYAGSVFDCTPDWFGIDITTFKENAYRLTRSQTAASSAMLGSGAGIAVGALTSGAISRAVDTQKAKKALDKANKSSDTVTSSENQDKKNDSDTDTASSANKGTENTDKQNDTPATGNNQSAQTTYISGQNKKPTDKQNDTPATGNNQSAQTTYISGQNKKPLDAAVDRLTQEINKKNNTGLNFKMPTKPQI